MEGEQRTPFRRAPHAFLCPAVGSHREPPCPTAAFAGGPNYTVAAPEARPRRGSGLGNAVKQVEVSEGH